MKTKSLIESIKRKALYLVLCTALTAGFSACSEEVLEEDIVGKYDGFSEKGLTTITISKNSSSFNFSCNYEDISNVEDSRDTSKEYNWSGTFFNHEGDNVINSNGDITGDVSFSKSDSEITVKFTAKTQRKGTYTASKGGDYAEYIPSRNSLMQDSISIRTDSLKSDTIK